MTTLYLLQPDAILSKKHEAFAIALKQPDDTWLNRSVAAQTIEQIILMGHPTITGEALTTALDLGIPVHYLSSFGKYLGSALPQQSRNGQLRLAQYGLYHDPIPRLHSVQAIVRAKIHNQALVLAKHATSADRLRHHKAQIKSQASIDQVRGIEGIAARDYFAGWQAMLDPVWQFTGRNRRPPQDPVNALLSFAYSLLQVQVMAAVHLVGLDPYIGYLHTVHHGQPALVLDLMEEFRPLVSDRLVLSVINRQEIKPDDFTTTLGACRLADRARSRFLQAIEQKFNETFTHPVFDYQCTYRRAIELQARLFARHLQEDIPYKPLQLR
ncbi:CRISPR-associated endonuclease Cas1 [Spirulina major]|uniref:CRISPR-associated endonuclease Cas1 n=1 Tax=Spirulina major TaxID=270636 RepID=UPI0009337B76|nr:CRISPR-associated endonuclease Cas1 [Spirulina major]